MTSIIYIIIAIVLYMAIYTAFKNAPFFQNANPTVMAICVTVLCVLGINQIVGKIELDYFLLPYATLAIALLSVLLLRGLLGFRNPKNTDFKEKAKKPELKKKKDDKSRLER